MVNPVYFVAPVLAFIFIKQVIVIFSCPLVKFPLVLKCLCFVALIAAQLIPLALCQKIFSTDLALPEAKPPVRLLILSMKRSQAALRSRGSLESR